MESIRLVGLAQDDPTEPTTGAGAAAKFVLDALERRWGMVARAGVEMSQTQRLALAARSFHSDRSTWRDRFRWRGLRALEARSRRSRRVLAGIEAPYDLVFQIFGLFQTRGAPYVLYLDNTAELSRRYWPAWVPLEGDELERLYGWERRLYGEAEHIFTQGTPHAESVTDFYGAEPDRVSVVGGGANFVPLPEVPDLRREKAILYVGADWERKDGRRLVEAFRLVRERNPDAVLRIVGSDRAAAEPGVDVRGFVDDRAEVARLYATSQVFCLPSRYDPYGLSVAEAMAYALPCVVTRVGALDEVVIDGETGRVVPPGDTAALADALSGLLDDPAGAAAMGAAGRRRVETHQNWDATVERMAPDLERVVASLRG